MRKKSQIKNWWETIDGAGTACTYSVPGLGIRPNIRLYSNIADRTWILDSRLRWTAQWREIASGVWPVPSVARAEEMRLAAIENHREPQ